MPGEQLTEAQRILVNKFLADARIKGGQDEMTAARDLLVLALDVSGSQADVLGRVAEVREELNNLPKRDFWAKKVEAPFEAFVQPSAPIEPEALPGIGVSKKSGRGHDYTEEHTDEPESLEDLAPLTRSIPSPFLGQTPIARATQNNPGTIKRARTGQDKEIKQRHWSRSGVSKLLFLIFLLVTGLGAWWYMEPAQIKQRNLNKSLTEAKAAMQQNRPDDAIKWAEEALAIDPAQFAVRITLIEALLATGNIPGAQSYLKEAAKLSDSWEKDIQIGRLWVKGGNLESAAEAYFNAFSKGGTAVAGHAEEIIKSQEAVGHIERAGRIGQMLGQPKSP